MNKLILLILIKINLVLIILVKMITNNMNYLIKFKE